MYPCNSRPSHSFSVVALDLALILTSFSLVHSHTHQHACERVCVRTNTSTCTRTCTHAHTKIRTHTLPQTHKRFIKQTRANRHLSTSLSPLSPLSLLAVSFARALSHTVIHAHTQTLTHTHTYTHTLTHTHTHTHTHVHTRTITNWRHVQVVLRWLQTNRQRMK